MANSVTYICFVRDHSGSMGTVAKQTKENFNERLAMMLKEDDDSIDNLVTVIEFDDEIHVNLENVELSTIKPLENYWTGGMTALNDAIMKGIDIIEDSMENDSREDKAAIVIIQTDGAENYSQKYPREKTHIVKERIKELEETGEWTVTFLGEGLTEKVLTIAADLGIQKGNTMAYGDKSKMRFASSVTSDSLGKFMGDRKLGKKATRGFYKK